MTTAIWRISASLNILYISNLPRNRKSDDGHLTSNEANMLTYKLFWMNNKTITGFVYLMLISDATEHAQALWEACLLLNQFCKA